MVFHFLELIVSGSVDLPIFQPFLSCRRQKRPPERRQDGSAKAGAKRPGRTVPIVSSAAAALHSFFPAQTNITVTAADKTADSPTVQVNVTDALMWHSMAGVPSTFLHHGPPIPHMPSWASCNEQLQMRCIVPTRCRRLR